jgi:hypothetical protein
MNLFEDLQKQSERLSGFKRDDQASSGDLITGVEVPVSIPYEDADIRIGIMLSPKVLQSPESLKAALDSLSRTFKLASFKQQSSFSFKRRY